MPTPHRRRVRHYDSPGQAHELTFSCYRRLPLLTNDQWREDLSRAIDRATDRHHWRLAAFVFMPEHLHLLVFSGEPSAKIADLLFAIKRPFSYRAKQRLVERASQLLEVLTVHQRPGVTTFRFWQEGPGYDRNLIGAEAIRAAIDYLHLNPVRRGLCRSAAEWRWSSARWYQSDGCEVDAALPRLMPLPSEVFYVGERGTL